MRREFEDGAEAASRELDKMLAEPLGAAMWRVPPAPRRADGSLVWSEPSRARVAEVARELARGASPAYREEPRTIAAHLFFREHSPLSLAIRRRDPLLTEALLAGGAPTGDTHALGELSKLGEEAMPFAELLARHGCDFSGRGASGGKARELPLAHWAAEREHLELFCWVAKRNPSTLSFASDGALCSVFESFPLGRVSAQGRFDGPAGLTLARAVRFCLEEGLLGPNEPVPSQMGRKALPAHAYLSALWAEPLPRQEREGALRLRLRLAEQAGPGGSAPLSLGGASSSFALAMRQDCPLLADRLAAFEGAAQAAEQAAEIEQAIDEAARRRAEPGAVKRL
jgi:hypothetical protein